IRERWRAAAERRRRTHGTAWKLLIGASLLTAAVFGHLSLGGQEAFAGTVSAARSCGSSGGGAAAARSSSLLARCALRTSSYRGVSWHEAEDTWQAHIADPVTGAPVSLGLFASEKDAGKAYDRSMIVLQGLSADTNFEKSTYYKGEIEREDQRLKDYYRPRPSSQYHGVYQTRGSDKWKAEIEIYGIKQFIDFFDDEVEAARAADRAVRGTGAERAMQLPMINFRQDSDYFDEATWDEA
ncbi:unnamed protein product, partial [Polarella glacialis]